MRWILILIMSLTLSGCLGNYERTDLATTGGAVLGAGISAAVGLPPLVTIASTAAGATAGAVLVGPAETTVDVLEAIPVEERAKALKNQQMWEAVESLGVYAIYAVLAFFLIPLIIGYFIPNGRQRRNTKEMIKLKETLFDDPNYSMKDLK